MEVNMVDIDIVKENVNTLSKRLECLKLPLNHLYPYFSEEGKNIPLSCT